jgi:catechol 2,3-dioxygenase
VSQASQRSKTVNPSLHHVNLKTTRMQELIDWYGKAVGLEVTHQAPGGAWLSNDTANHRLALLSVPGLADDPAKTEHAGIHHMAYEFPTFKDLMENFDQLRREGIEPTFCLDHGMTMSMYYRDPDGNFVELQSDIFGDWAKSKAYMKTSPEFEADPIGTFFDPARLYDAYKSGRSLPDLHRAARGGEFLPDPIPGLVGLPPRPE